MNGETIMDHFPTDIDLLDHESLLRLQDHLRAVIDVDEFCTLTDAEQRAVIEQHLDSMSTVDSHHLTAQGRSALIGRLTDYLADLDDDVDTGEVDELFARANARFDELYSKAVDVDRQLLEVKLRGTEQVAREVHSEPVLTNYLLSALYVIRQASELRDAPLTGPDLTFAYRVEPRRAVVVGLADVKNRPEREAVRRHRKPGIRWRTLLIALAVTSAACGLILDPSLPLSETLRSGLLGAVVGIGLSSLGGLLRAHRGTRRKRSQPREERLVPPNLPHDQAIDRCSLSSPRFFSWWLSREGARESQRC